jgi:hypothetical protein
MEQSPSWEAKQFLASYEIPCIVWNPKAHYRIHKCPLPWASSIQSISPHLISWRSILILSSYLCLGLPSGSFPQVTPPKPCIQLSSPSHVFHAPAISFFSICSPENIGWGVVPAVALLIMCIFVHPEFTSSVKPTFHFFKFLSGRVVLYVIIYRSLTSNLHTLAVKGSCSYPWVTLTG